MNGANKKDVRMAETWASTSTEDSKSSPWFYNAFELISSLSSGFELSTLFENNESIRIQSRSLFISKLSALGMMGRLEAAAKKLNFVVSSGEEFTLKMQKRGDEKKGQMSVIAEVFEVALYLTVVELSKRSGDTLEYVQFVRRMLGWGSRTLNGVGRVTHN